MKKITSIIFVSLISVFIAVIFTTAPLKVAAESETVTAQNIYTPGTCGVELGNFFSLGQILANFNGADSTKGLDSVYCFIIEIIAILLNWGGIVAVAFVLYASFLYVTSYGDDQKIELAKKTLIWAIVGIAIITFSALIVNLISTELFKIQ